MLLKDMIPGQQVEVKEISGLEEFSELNDIPQSDDYKVSLSMKKGVFIITKR